MFTIGIVLDSLANNLVEDVSEEWMSWRLAGVNLKSVCVDVDPQVMLTRFNAAVLSDTLVQLSVGTKFTLPNVLKLFQSSVFFTTEYVKLLMYFEKLLTDLSKYVCIRPIYCAAGAMAPVMQLLVLPDLRAIWMWLLYSYKKVTWGR